jgi:hypothetical protein
MTTRTKTRTIPRPRARLTAAGPPVTTMPAPTPAADPMTAEPSDGSATAPDTSKPLPDDSAMVCLIPPPEIAAQLAVEGGQPVEALHVTLAYLGPIAGLDREDLEDAIAATLEAMADSGDDDGDETGDGGAVDPDEDGDADSAMLSGTFNGAAIFAASDDPAGTPIVATLDAPGLMPLVDTIGEALRANVDGLPAPTHGLVPHCTVAFAAEGADLGTAVSTLAAKLPIAVAFDHLVLAFGDMAVPANLTFFPLSGEEPQDASDEPPINDADASDPDNGSTGIPAARSGNGTAPQAADGAPVSAAGKLAAVPPAASPADAAPAPDAAPTGPSGGNGTPFVPAPYSADPDETVTCPACGKMDDTDASFCDQCGAGLTPTTAYAADADEIVECPSCNLMNSPDAIFCDQCSAKLAGNPAVKIVVPSAPVEPDASANNDGDGAPGQQGVSRFRGTRGYPATWATPDDAAPEAVDPAAPASDAGGKVQPVVGQLGMWEALIVTAGQPTDADDISRLIPSPDTLTFRTPPLPVTFTLADTGHSDAPIGGAATEVTWDGDNLMAKGPYLSGPNGEPTPQGQAFKDAVDAGAPISPSIDMGGSSIWEELVDEDDKATASLVSGIVCGFAVLPFAAQDTTWIRSIPNSGVVGAQTLPTTAPAVIPGEPTTPPVMAAALVATGGLAPDPSLFANPNLSEETPLTVDDQHVYGHIATWKTCHRAFTASGEVCLTPPHSKTGYRAFLTGAVLCADGSRQPVGPITVGHGHNPHFDNSTYAAAYVNVGEDEYGIWASGVISPWATPEQVFALQASPPSGEWDYERDPRTGRKFPGGNLELKACLGVPVPGFPVYRVKALVASGAVERFSLVADFGHGQWAVTGSADLPIADRDTAWSGDDAAKAVAKYASSDGSGDPDKIDWSKYAQAFFWRDDSDGGEPKLGDFKLGFADIVNGRLQAIPNGVIAVAGVLSGARGGVDIPDAAAQQIKGRVAGYYSRINKAAGSDLTPPWEAKAAVTASAWRAAGLALFGQDVARIMGRMSTDQQRVLAHARKSAASRVK